MGGKITKIFNILITGALMCLIMVSVGTVLVRGLPLVVAQMREPELIFSLKLSLFTSLVSTAMCLLVAVPVAYTLSRYRLPVRE